MTEKTPWNPSKTAIKKVKNALPPPNSCRYCGGKVVVKHHNEVYGKPYSDWPWLYHCEGCDASTGMHPFTDIPLGTLANSEIRKLRGECKQVFIRLYKELGLKRKDAYRKLAAKLSISTASCHFGWFDEDTLIKARQASEQIIKELKAPSK